MLVQKRIGTDESEMILGQSAYATTGWMKSSTNALNGETYCAETFPSSKRQVLTTLPDTSTVTELYYRDGRLEKRTDSATRPVKYEYGKEPLDSIYREYTLETKLDASGNPTSETVKTYYDGLGRVIKTLYAGGAAAYAYYNSKGQLWKQVDPDGVITLFTYNDEGEREMTVVDLDQNSVVNTTGTDRITKVVRDVTTYSSTDVQRVQTYVYDTDSSATETLVATSMKSTDGTKNWQVRDDDASTPASVVVTLAATTYQGSGQRTQTVTYPDSSQVVSVYQNGRPTTVTRKNSSGGTVAQTSYAYDEHGRTETVTDLRNGATSYTYNAADQVASTTTPVPNDGSPPQVTTLSYDEYGMGRQTISLLPDGTTVTNDYNDLGLVIKVTGSRTYPVEYTYDAQGRMATMKTWQDYVGGTGTATTTWYYDSQRGWLEKKVYQGETDTTDDYEYKSSGRVWKRHWERGITTTYAYIQANQRTRMSLADGSYWVYQYDQLGQVISGRRFWADGTPVAGQQFEYGFDDIGNRTSTGGRESAVSDYTVNALNQYTERDVAGKIDVFGIANPTADVTVEAVDADRHGEYFHRVVTVSNGSAAQYPQIDVISEFESTQTVQGNYFVPKDPELYDDPTTPTIPGDGHDPDGNLTYDGRWHYAWDGENRLASLTKLYPTTDTSKVKDPATATLYSFQQVRFEYDWQGRRIAKRYYATPGATTPVVAFVYLYDGWNLIAELNANSSNAKIRTYVWGNDLSGSMQGARGVGGLLKVVDHGATTTGHFVAYDGNGSVMGLVAEDDGELTARYEYGPFAEPLRASGAQAANPFRFSTKYCDAESGLYYYGRRYYNPTTGRWLSRDPIEETGGVHLYGFVRDNALQYVDAFGTQEAPRGCCGSFLLVELTDIVLNEDEKVAAGGKDTLDGFKVLFLPDKENCLCPCPPNEIFLSQVYQWNTPLGNWTDPSFDGGSAKVSPAVEYPPYGKPHGPEGRKSLIDAPYNPHWRQKTFRAEVCAICRRAGKGDVVLGCVVFTFDDESRQLTVPGGQAAPPELWQQAGKGRGGGTPDGPPRAGQFKQCEPPSDIWKKAVPKK